MIQLEMEIDFLSTQFYFANFLFKIFTGATSLSSLPASNAEDTPKYFWDSFDLNNPEGVDNGDNKNMNTELTANPGDNASFVSESSAGDRSRLLLQTASANIGPG